MARAVVMGGGFAGLLGAEVLSRHYDEVLILDRCIGVPQAVHLHVLLQRGRLALEQLFPGLDAELEEYGCPEIDWAKDTYWVGRFGIYPRYVSKTRTRSCSRTLLEKIIKNRVLGKANISVERFIVEGCDGKTAYDAAGRRREGSIFIDAGGRAGPFRKLTPRVEINAMVGYASCLLRVTDPGQHPFKQAYVQLSPPVHQRGGVLIPIEDGLHMLTLIGAGGDHPTADVNAFKVFARSLRDPVLSQVLDTGELIGGIHCYRKTAGIRSKNSVPSYSNVISLGDAKCTFNPVYGQGMTVAALSALTIERQLKSKRSFSARRIADASFLPWVMGAAEDLRVVGCKTSGLGTPGALGLGLLGAVMDAGLKTATRSKRMHQGFLHVLHMMVTP